MTKYPVYFLLHRVQHMSVVTRECSFSYYRKVWDDVIQSIIDDLTALEIDNAKSIAEVYLFATPDTTANAMIVYGMLNRCKLSITTRHAALNCLAKYSSFIYYTYENNLVYQRELKVVCI